MTTYGTEDTTRGRRPRTIVATFDNLEAAREALDELGDKDSGIQSGSMLLRDQSGSIYMRDLDDRSLGEIARNGINLGTFVIIGGLGILVDAAMSTGNLLLRSSGRAFDLAGSLVKSPVHRMRAILLPDPDLKTIGNSLQPGGSAIVVDVDADKSAEVAARLVARGAAVDMTTD